MQEQDKQQRGVVDHVEVADMTAPGPEVSEEDVPREQHLPLLTQHFGKLGLLRRLQKVSEKSS